MTTAVLPSYVQPATGPRRDTTAARLAAPARGLALAGLSVAAIVGVALLPAAIRAQRRAANIARDRAGRWSGVTIPRPYRAGRGRAMVTDPATWRDQLWGLLNPVVGALLALLPASLIAYGAFGAVVQPFVWRSIQHAGGSNWYTAIHVHTATTAAISVPIGVALMAIGLWFGPAILRVHARWTRSLLG